MSYRRYTELPGECGFYRLTIDNGLITEIAIHIPPRGFGGRGFYMPAKAYTSLKDKQELGPVPVRELRRLCREGQIMIV